MAEFHRDYPNVEMAMSTDDSHALLDQLRGGHLDAAVVSIGIDEEPDGIAVETVTEEAIDAAVSPDHPLAKRTSLTLAALCEHPLISLPAGTGLRTRVEAACAAAGLPPRIAFEANSPLALAELAEYGLCVAIVPRSVARGAPSLHPLRLDPELRGRLVYAWRADQSPAARIFTENARAAIRAACPQD